MVMSRVAAPLLVERSVYVSETWGRVPGRAGVTMAAWLTLTIAATVAVTFYAKSFILFYRYIYNFKVYFLIN